jgi:outer membrane protein assembly factor BamE (lipoprotein component of BamABCDE complex)
MKRSLPGIALGLLCTTMLSGCLVTSKSSVSESGTQISSPTLQQITLGETTEAWLVATLGEPDQITSVDGETHIKVLRYRHTTTRTQSGTVFLLFAGSSKHKQCTSTYFEVVDGTINRFWVERDRN